MVLQKVLVLQNLILLLGTWIGSSLLILGFCKSLFTEPIFNIEQRCFSSTFVEGRIMVKTVAVIIYGNLWKLPSSAEVVLAVQSLHFESCVPVLPNLWKAQLGISLLQKSYYCHNLCLVLCLGTQQSPQAAAALLPLCMEQRLGIFGGLLAGWRLVSDVRWNRLLQGPFDYLWVDSCGWRVNKSVPSVASRQTRREGPRLELLQSACIRAPCWRPVCSSWQTQIKQTVFVGICTLISIRLVAMESCTLCCDKPWAEHPMFCWWWWFISPYL